MATGLNRVLSFLQGTPKGSELTDRELLRRFTHNHDQAAFEQIVQRHGGMVLAVCRKLLHDRALADDVFQAVFLVLVRKAGSLAWQESIGGWLHEVAQRLSVKTNGLEQARRHRESELPAMTEKPDRSASDLELALHEELRRLPEKYRSPLVLCYLEGKSGDQAAQDLGIAANALHVRLHRGREVLRDRLSRRGVALTSAAVASILSEQAATASVPIPLNTTTVQVALQVAIGKGMGVSPLVPLLVEGAIQDMFAHNFRRMVVTCLTIAVLATGVGLLSHALAEPSKPGSTIVLKPVTKEETNKTIAGNTRFATDMYGQLRKEKGNLFLSPYSISTALAMTYAGARGNTEAEMAKTLHFDLPQEKIHTAFGELVKQANGNGKDRGYKLAVANRLFGQGGYGFRPDFLKLTDDAYGAGLEEVDFAGATEAARKTINAWVEKQTEDKIKELLKEGILDADTRLVLTNAIYFKGNWKTEFDKKKTREVPFFTTKEDKKNSPVMHMTKELKYRKGDKVDVLELPYKNDELSMVVYLPKEIDGLADFEKMLTAEEMTKLYPTEKKEVDVRLPKFKFTAEFSLKDQLIALGMKDAFAPHAADFSGMCSKKLYISHVIHKAFVDVNEEGTEAAAATAVVMNWESATPKRTPVFNANHPFLFLIKDNKTNSVLFVGRVCDPTKS